MTGWEQLAQALNAADRRGETLRFWWRDDDAGRPAAALARLLELSARQDAPLGLAVVPTWLETPVRDTIAATGCSVLQHGYAHRNHAREGEKSVELGARASGAVIEELKEGLSILKEAFGPAFLPALVPPWNRIDPALHSPLGTLGYRGLSVYGRRAQVEVAPGVSLINTHVDPIDWRGTRGFVGEEILLQRLVGQLDPNEPIGLLTHHLVMDEACWAFVERLLSILQDHPAARLSHPVQLFGLPDLSSGQAA